jgi:hypothetical protein
MCGLIGQNFKSEGFEEMGLDPTPDIIPYFSDSGCQTACPSGERNCDGDNFLKFLCLTGFWKLTIASM